MKEKTFRTFPVKKEHFAFVRPQRPRLWGLICQFWRPREVEEDEGASARPVGLTQAFLLFNDDQLVDGKSRTEEPKMDP